MKGWNPGWTPPPPTVQVKASSRKSLTMSWVNDEDTQHIWKYKVKVTSGKRQAKKYNCEITTAELRNCELTGLSPYTQYNVTVRACASKNKCSPPIMLVATTAGPALHPFLITLIAFVVLLAVACCAVHFDVLHALCCPSLRKKKRRTVEFPAGGTSAAFLTTPTTITAPSTPTTITAFTTPTKITTHTPILGRQQNQARMMTPIRPLDTVNAMTEQRTRDHVSGGRSSSPAVHACVKTSWSASSNMSSPATDHDHDPPNYDTAILQADVHREYKLSSGHHADRQFPGQLSSNCQADRQFPGQLSSNYHADRQFPGQLPSSYQADRQFPGQLPSNHHADRQPAGWR